MRLKTNTKAEHGAAMVELVVLLLIFVPLIMLPLYFQDAIRYKLDAQEAVYSTAWDFAYANYDEKSTGDINVTIEQKNGEIFKNLWSGNKNEKQNPAGPWANFEWEGNASQPVTCSGSTDFSRPMGLALMAASFHDKWTKGGFVECKGNIKVENHYIPQVFNTNFTGNNDKDMFIEKNDFISYMEDGEPYKFGIMVDPWSISDPADIKEDGSGNDLFKERVEYCYKEGTSIVTYEIFELAFIAFAAQLVSNEISIPSGALLGQIDYPPRPTDITSLHLANSTMSISGGLSGNIDFWVSPFKDGDDNKYEETFNARENFYLGCKRLEPNCTN
jgi:hypothetical protein